MSRNTGPDSGVIEPPPPDATAVQAQAPEARPGIASIPTRRGNRNGIALCLSGGGFRASLFHLGSLRRLHEVGVLPRVRTISSVSGGSILSGYLAGLMIERGMSSGMQFKDWDEVALGFRAVARRDLRTWPVLAHLLWNWALPGPRVRHLVSRYRRRLTGRTLGELPEEPSFVFCASDMVFGVNWTFHRGGSDDYQAGAASGTAAWPIARAVAASACFPPVFGPMPLGLRAGDFAGGSYRGADREALLSRMSLSDGGVYDNMALEPAWKSHEWVLVSDCGAPFGFQAPGSYIRRLLRYTSVVTNQAAAMRKRAFFADIAEDDPKAPPRYRGGYWGIAGAVARYKDQTDPLEGYSQELVDEVIERVRTDLDRFTEPEMCVLENHGYLLTAAVLSRRRPELVGPASRIPRAPYPEWMDEDRVRWALRDSHKRFSLRRLF